MKKIYSAILIVFLLIFLLIVGCRPNLNKKSFKGFDNIVFASDPSGSLQLYTMAETGKNKRLLLDSAAGVNTLAASKGGRYIMFFTRNKNNQDLYTLSNKGRLENISKTPKGLEKLATFSPDGKKIGYSAYIDDNFEIMISNIDGRGRRRLTNNRVPDIYPVFTRNMKQIYWTKQEIEPKNNVTGFEIKDQSSEIALMDVDGKNKKQLTFNKFEDGVESISSDGKWLASAAIRDQEFWDIMVYSSDGQKQVRITSDKEYDEGAMWHPNTNKIIWKKGINYRFDLFITDFPSLRIKNLTHGLGDNQEHGWTDDGRIIFSSDRDGDYEIYIMDADGSNVRKLTNNDYDDRYPVWISKK